MRTTISISDEVYSEAREVMGSRPFSEFASEAIQDRVLRLKSCLLYTSDAADD